MEKNYSDVLNVLNSLINRLDQAKKSTDTQYRQILDTLNQMLKNGLDKEMKARLEKIIAYYVNENVKAIYPKIQTQTEVVNNKIQVFEGVIERNINKIIYELESNSVLSVAKIQRKHKWHIVSLMLIILGLVILHFKDASNRQEVMKNDMKYRFMQKITNSNAVKLQVHYLDSIIDPMSVQQADQILKK